MADITRLQKAKLAHRDAWRLRAVDFIEYARWRCTEEEAGPATVLNDIVWLRQACLGAVARYGTRAIFAGLGRKEGSCRQLTDHCASRVQCLQVCLMGNKI